MSRILSGQFYPNTIKKSIILPKITHVNRWTLAAEICKNGYKLFKPFSHNVTQCLRFPMVWRSRRRALRMCLCAYLCGFNVTGFNSRCCRIAPALARQCEHETLSQRSRCRIRAAHSIVDWRAQWPHCVYVKVCAKQAHAYSSVRCAYNTWLYVGWADVRRQAAVAFVVLSQERVFLRGSGYEPKRERTEIAFDALRIRIFIYLYYSSTYVTICYCS